MADYFDSSVVLKLKPFRGSAAAIVRELSDASVLEGEFLVDPAGFLASRLHGPAAARLPRRRLDGANRLLFSIMSNERFLGWTRDYQDKLLRELEEDPHAVVDRDRLRTDLAKAMIEFGDAEIVASILPSRFRPGLTDPDLVFDVIGNIAGRPVSAVQVVVQDAVSVQVISGFGGEMASVAVEVETLIYAVAAVAVFAVAVAAVLIGALERFGDRVALNDVFIDASEMVHIADALTRVGGELRSRGRL